MTKVPATWRWWTALRCPWLASWTELTSRVRRPAGPPEYGQHVFVQESGRLLPALRGRHPRAALARRPRERHVVLVRGQQRQRVAQPSGRLPAAAILAPRHRQGVKLRRRRSRNRRPLPLARTGILGGHLREEALVPVPAGRGAALPPQRQHAGVAEGRVPAADPAPSPAPVHRPTRTGSVLPGTLVARHPQLGHQRLHLNLPGVTTTTTLLYWMLRFPPRKRQE
ncbi:uncharacterized protein jmjd8 isoform X2 [Syngnathoides biaculeatus]|uniref:uncharacterized protein jmjd8 isoform X2 n=1 Tax=Syngnathoides biaculeatus TaxID=300417 RepID=UPI002ADD7504|nr:uncharacterized protein jmjd8 isoform X2 [Syngnathoides biaculeatus]